jgi:hypothetical protein
MGNNIMSNDKFVRVKLSKNKIEHTGTTRKRRVVKVDITRDQFHALVQKAAQPVEDVKSDSTSSET